MKKCKTIDDVIGKDGLIQRLVKDVLEGEIENHLGSSFSDVDLDIPRDRNAEFEPQIIKKSLAVGLTKPNELSFG